MEKAATVDKIKEGKPLGVSIGGKRLAIFKLKNKYYCIDAICPHAHGPLDEGAMAKPDVVRCPWHGSEFSIKTGKLVKGPAKTGVKAYKAEVKGKDIFVDV